MRNAEERLSVWENIGAGGGSQVTVTLPQGLCVSLMLPPTPLWSYFKTGRRPGNQWGVYNDPTSSCLLINQEILSKLLKFSVPQFPRIS